MINKEKLIFIHVPKTGGTTINTAMNNSFWQTEVGFNYRHILPNKVSNSGDIFDPTENEKYLDFVIFMMLRQPIDRVTSEYHFIKERKEFINLLQRKPKDFQSYVKNEQTNNGTVNFLKGRRMYSKHRSSEDDLTDIINTIEKIPVHVGIFEYFNESLSYFSDIAGIKWGRKIEVKRMTLRRPGIQEIPEDLIELINERNSLDLKLYNHCLKLFNEKLTHISKKKITFIKDKYNHVIPYCMKWCFFEFCLENKKFINSNLNFFKKLTFYLIQTKKIKDGKLFTKAWNKTFLNTFNHAFNESILNEKLQICYNKNVDPLEQLIKIAKQIDDFLKENNADRTNYYRPLEFNEKLVETYSNKIFSSFLGR